MKFNLEKSIPILQHTPVVLNHLLHDLSDEWILSNEGHETWSPFDVVGHLIEGEKNDWMQRLKIILYEENKLFKPFDRFAQYETSKGKKMHDLLNEFYELRKQNLDALMALKIGPDKYNLKGMHPALGEVTLGNLLATWVAHDLSHISQITRVMAKQYQEEVGPWIAYMPVFTR